MAEDNLKKQHIRIHVYDEDFTIAVRPEDEPLYRRAAKFITERYNKYAEMFKLQAQKYVSSANETSFAI